MRHATEAKGVSFGLLGQDKFHMVENYKLNICCLISRGVILYFKVERLILFNAKRGNGKLEAKEVQVNSKGLRWSYLAQQG